MAPWETAIQPSASTTTILGTDDDYIPAMTTPITTSTTTNKGTPPDYDDTTETTTKTTIPGLPKAEAIAPAMVEGNTSLTTIGPCQLHAHRHTVGFGNNDDGRCNIPVLEAGVSYTQASAGECHTVLLKSTVNPRSGIGFRKEGYTARDPH